MIVQAEDAVSFHSKQAQDWTGQYATPTFAVRFEVLNGLLQPRQLAGQYWLDAGCGTGTLGRWLAEKHRCRVLGVDASAEMIEQCTAVPGTEFRAIEDVCKLRLDDRQFDGVLCSSVLEYLDSPVTALRELRRVLHDDGLLLVSVPNAHFWTRLSLWVTYWATRPLGRRRKCAFLDHSKWCFSPESFSQLLRDAGFLALDYRKYGECPLDSLGVKTEGSMIMFLAKPA
ncbi:MAG: methyltransferase domain-containing protein [Candidatus Sulfotelmatobacter sp.]